MSRNLEGYRNSPWYDELRFVFERLTILLCQNGYRKLRGLVYRGLFWVSLWDPNAGILEPPELQERARQWFAATAARYQ